MEWFLSLIRTLSVVSVVLAAVWMLVPKGGMEKSFRFVLGVFALGAVVSAVCGPAMKVEFDLERYEKEYAETAESISAANAEFVIGKLLESESIFFKNITPITDKSADGSIHITKAAVELYREQEWERAAALVLQETGIELVGG